MNKFDMIKKIKSSDLNNYFVRSNIDDKIISVNFTKDGAYKAIVENWQEENEASDYVMEYVDQDRLIKNMLYRQYTIYNVETLEEVDNSIVEEIYNYLY